MNIKINGLVITATAETLQEAEFLISLKEKGLKKNGDERASYTRTCKELVTKDGPNDTLIQEECGKKVKGLIGLGIHKKKMHGISKAGYIKKEDRVGRKAENYQAIV